MCSSLHSLQLLFNVENANARVYLYVELYIALFARELAFECFRRRRLLLSADLSDSNVHGVKDLYNVNALFKNGTTVSRVGDSPSSGVCDSSDDLVRTEEFCVVSCCIVSQNKTKGSKQLHGNILNVLEIAKKVPRASMMTNKCTFSLEH